MKDSLKILLAVFALVIVGGCIYLFMNKTEDLRYVVISINPEIELAVNNDNVVEDIVSINDDAEAVIADLDVVGKDLDTALDTVVDATIETGYLDEYSDENAVIVTTMDEDEEDRTELEKEATEKIQQRLEEKKAYAVVLAYGLTEELKTQATTLGISNGKMLLISKAMTVDSTLKAEDLATKSIKEIQAIIKEARKANKNNAELKAAKEALKTAYQEKVKTYRDDLLEDEDVDTTGMTEQQKNEAAKEILKDKKEAIKAKVAEYKQELREKIDSEGYKNIRDQIKEARDKVKNGKN